MYERPDLGAERHRGERERWTVIVGRPTADGLGAGGFTADGFVAGGWRGHGLRPRWLVADQRLLGLARDPRFVDRGGDVAVGGPPPAQV